MVSQETGSREGNRVDDAERFDAPTILHAYCRARLVELPRGGRGTRAAVDLLTAIPKCSRLGWADMTVSAPQLFRMLEHAELLSSRPAASDMTAALRLVASVCPRNPEKRASRVCVVLARLRPGPPTWSIDPRGGYSGMLHRSAGMLLAEDIRAESREGWAAI